MIAVRAAWCLPITSPARRHATLLVDEGRIVGLTGGLPPASVPLVDLPRHVLLPALVNAHTHLELSWMAGKVPADESMPAWAGRLLARRREAGTDDPAAMDEAIAEVKASGTDLVGDIGNTLASVRAFAAAGVAATVFLELIGFRSEMAAERLAWGRTQREAANAATTAGRGGVGPVRVALAAHAPYSVSPALLAGVAREADVVGTPWCLHLGESAEEVAFLHDGGGPWRALLEAVGAWDPSWSAPACGPVYYLARLGVLGPRLVAVHGVHLADAELEMLKSAGASLVTCPRSNEWTGAGRAPVERFYASGARVALGTDSLASVGSLSVFDELAHVHDLAPAVAPERLVRSATLDGARALGREADFGSLEPGKRARVIAVELPAAALEERAASPEAWLVAGVATGRVSWPDVTGEQEA